MPTEDTLNLNEDAGHENDLRSTISDALEKHTSSEPEAPSSPSPSPKREEAPSEIPLETKTDISTTPAEAVKAETPTPPKEEDEGFIPPPHSWAGEYKEKFAQIPRDLQRVIAEREQSRDAFLTRTGREVAELRRQYGSYEQAIEPHRGWMSRAGVEPAKAFNQFLEWQRHCDADPVQGCLDYLATYGLTPENLIGRQANYQPADPYVEQLQSQVSQLAARLEEKESYSQQQQQFEVNNTIQAFEQERDTSGKLLRPHFNYLRNEIAPMVAALRSQDPYAPHQKILQEAYDRCVYANPRTRADVLKRESEAQIAKAKSLGSSISGAPAGQPGQSTAKHKGLRQTIESAFEQHS